MVLARASGRSAKAGGHLVRALEIVLARDAAAVILDDVAPVGDAQQRVVGLVVVGDGEVDLVGGDERDFVLA